MGLRINRGQTPSNVCGGIVQLSVCSDLPVTVQPMESVALGRSGESAVTSIDWTQTGPGFLDQEEVSFNSGFYNPLLADGETEAQRREVKRTSFT